MEERKEVGKERRLEGTNISINVWRNDWRKVVNNKGRMGSIKDKRKDVRNKRDKETIFFFKN